MADLICHSESFTLGLSVGFLLTVTFVILVMIVFELGMAWGRRAWRRDNG